MIDQTTLEKVVYSAFPCNISDCNLRRWFDPKLTFRILCLVLFFFLMAIFLFITYARTSFRAVASLETFYDLGLKNIIYPLSYSVFASVSLSKWILFLLFFLCIRCINVEWRASKTSPPKVLLSKISTSEQTKMYSTRAPLKLLRDFGPERIISFRATSIINTTWRTARKIASIRWQVNRLLCK